MTKRDKQDLFLRLIWLILILSVWLLSALLLVTLLVQWFLTPLLELLDPITVAFLTLPSFVLYLIWKRLLIIPPIKEAQQKLMLWARNTLTMYGQYALSLFLDAIAGYGYKPGRSLGWYAIVIIGFAIAASSVGAVSNHPLSWNEALVFSVTSFHGRGFFPGPDTALRAPLTALAAAEAIVGLTIEISFIATFTQRFFGK